MDRDGLMARIEEGLRRLERLDAILRRRPTPDPRPSVILVGPANAGKSSLFNVLTRSGRVIVSDRPGTTRDALEGSAQARGRAYRLIDGPGLDGGRDPLDRLADFRFSAWIDRARVALVVLDRSAPFDPDLLGRVFERVHGLPSLIVFNKSDLPRHPGWSLYPDERPRVEISARTGKGLQSLEAALSTILPKPADSEGGGATFEALRLIERARGSFVPGPHRGLGGHAGPRGDGTSRGAKCGG